MSTTATRGPAAPPVADGAPVTPRKGGLPPILILAGTAALITASSIAAWFNGRSGIDLAIFHQGLFVASRNLTQPAGIIQETLFEDHFAPGMLLFVALYRLVASPVWLFVAQGAAAFAAAKLIADRLRPSIGERLSAWVGAGLLISPPVAYCLLWDVHFVVMAVPFGLAAALAVEDGRPKRALVLGFIAALFRSDVGFAALAAFAVLPGDRRGRLRPGLALAGYLIVAQYFEQALGHAIFWDMHYAHLGTGPLDVVTHPWRVVDTLLSWKTAWKAIPWVVTGGLLCFRRPRLAIPAMVVAMPVLLSRWPGTETFVFQYGLAPTFFLALAWIPLARDSQGARRVVTASVALGAVIGPVLPALAFPGFGYSYAASRWIPDRQVQCIVRGIPASAGVSAEASSLARLAQRDAAYLWPFPFAPAPDDTLPGPQHRKAVPELSGGVDYLLMPRNNEDPIPPGFTEDGATEGMLRFRRIATTEPAAHPCTP